MTERWAPAPACDGYEVSDQGRIRNLHSGRIFTGTQRPDGYLQARLGPPDVVKLRLVHQIIKEAFDGPCPPSMIVCHDDDVRTHNALSNLVYGTHAKNAAQRVANRRARGIDACSAKLTRDPVLEIVRRLDDGAAMLTLALEFEVSESRISGINRGTQWGWLTGRNRAHARQIHRERGRYVSLGVSR